MTYVELDGLPGAELLSKGVADLEAGISTSPEALLVAMAPTKLSGLGVGLPELAWQIDEPELTLYRLLSQTHLEPYREYNALKERFFKLEYTLEARVLRLARPRPSGRRGLVVRTQASPEHIGVG